MLAQHAARGLAGRAGLRAEAWCVGGDAHRELGLVHDGFADEVGQRDFGGGDEPEALSVFSFFPFLVVYFSISLLILFWLNAFRFCSRERCEQGHKAPISYFPLRKC